MKNSKLSQSPSIWKQSLYDELDLDSIDAVDLVVKLRETTGKKIDPEAFKQVRTISDVVDEMEKLLVK